MVVNLVSGRVHTYPDIIKSHHLFFADSASVHTYPVNPADESTFFLIRSPEWKLLNTLWIRNRVDAKSGYIFIPPLTQQHRVQAHIVQNYNVLSLIVAVGNAIHRINLYPLDNAIGFPNNDHFGRRDLVPFMLMYNFRGLSYKFPTIFWRKTQVLLARMTEQIQSL